MKKYVTALATAVCTAALFASGAFAAPPAPFTAAGGSSDGGACAGVRTQVTPTIVQDDEWCFGPNIVANWFGGSIPLGTTVGVSQALGHTWSNAPVGPPFVNPTNLEGTYAAVYKNPAYPLYPAGTLKGLAPKVDVSGQVVPWIWQSDKDGLIATSVTFDAANQTPASYTPTSSECTKGQIGNPPANNKFADKWCHDRSGGHEHSRDYSPWNYTLVVTPASHTPASSCGTLTNQVSELWYTPAPSQCVHLVALYGETAPVIPPVVDVCSNIDGAQATVPVGDTAKDGICTLIPVDTVKVVASLPFIPSPNADAFCYGVGANSYTWVTPAQFLYLTTAKQPDLGGKPYWATGFSAFAVKGVDPTGVMKNGYKPSCAKGTTTGVVVNNQGETVTGGYVAAIQNWGGDQFGHFPANPAVKNANGKGAIPEWYEVVTS